MEFQKLNANKNLLFNFFSLFTSASTLICCALPALFVALGMGATLMGLVTNFPQLIWISEHKIEVFGLAGLLLAIAGGWQYKAAHLPCPIDLVEREACTKARKWSLGIYLISVFIFIIGGFFAFILPVLS